LLAVVVILAMLGGCTGPADFLGSLPQGWAKVAAYGHEHGKLRLLDTAFDPSMPYTLWAGLLGGVFIALATHGADQLMVQRYLSARSQKEAGRALALSGFVVCGQFALFLLIGVGLACFYHVFEPKTVFEKGDQVFPAFIVRYLPMGSAGLIVAAVFSAAMSTLSSSLNSSAAAAVNDLYLPLCKKKPSPKHLLRVSRLLTVAFGLVQIGVGIAGQGLRENVIESVMAISLFTTGVILGVFFLGILTRHVTQRGALAALVAGLALMTTIVFVLPLLVGETVLAWPWFAIVGSSATVAFGLVANALLPGGEVEKATGPLNDVNQ
jgi:Na+/proline symporter